MIDLFRSELRRALTRRLLRVATITAVAGIILAGLIVFLKSNRVPVDALGERALAGQIERCARGEMQPPDVGDRFDNIPPGDVRTSVCERLLTRAARSPQDHRFDYTQTM